MRHHFAALLALSATTLTAAPSLAEIDIAAMIMADGPESAAEAVSADAAADFAILNDARMTLKVKDQSAAAESFFDALIEIQDTPAVRLNLSLSYVDQMAGKSLLGQGHLSTRSQSAVAPLLDVPAYEWVAAYISGLNNLYWPDWFGKADNAQEHLEHAVAIYQKAPDGEGVHYARGWLGLGDALALQDELAEARAAWREGLRYFPYDADLRARLELGESDIYETVRALRDADAEIDTDLAFLWTRGTPAFTITLTGGDLFGPGPLPDQRLDPGSLQHLILDRTLTGVIEPNNNGAAEPNAPGELRQNLEIDGLLSDGTEVQESIDVGFVELMNGKFKLFLAAIQGGRNDGRVNFYLDRSLSWTIQDDIGIDPGFPVGVIKFEDFTFSTSPRPIPISWQTENGAPGSRDGAGSLVSGDLIEGRLGDSDFDGYVDGVFNAIGRFPLNSIMLPGAPFAQTREFTSDIPVTPESAATFALASRRSALIHAATAKDPSAEQLTTLAATLHAEAETHLEAASTWSATLALEEQAAIETLLAIGPEDEMATLCDTESELALLAEVLALKISEKDVSMTSKLCIAR